MLRGESPPMKYGVRISDRRTRPDRPPLRLRMQPHLDRKRHHAVIVCRLLPHTSPRTPSCVEASMRQGGRVTQRTDGESR